VGGDFTKYNGIETSYLVRLNSDGSLDNTFSQEGIGLLNNSVNTIGLQSDGKILIAGYFTYNEIDGIRIARLNSDGSLDETFSQTGTGLNGSVKSIVIQPNGKILVAGYFISYNGVARSHIARLNSDGSLDTTFSQEGTGLNDDAYSIELQPNGKILVAGYFSSYNGVERKYVEELGSENR
jgi:uncharacterized delta-60 repeat protein